MKPNNNNDDRVGDWVNISKEQWLLYAVLSGIFFVLMSLLGSVWLLGIADFGLAIDDIGIRARAAGPIGAFLLAIVTFFTIGWRGKVQEDQAGKQRRSNNSTDENNQAILLQKGAELLSDEDEGKVAAGIACLEAVVTAENRRFGTQAMNLLAKYVERKHQRNHFHYLCISAIEAIKSGVFNNCKITTSIVFVNTSKDRNFWQIIPGAESIRYSNGSIEVTDKNEIGASYRFSSCYFGDSEINDITTKFRRCEFDEVSISKCSISSIFRSIFRRCNFSGTVFYGTSFKEIMFENVFSSCYYYSDTPPICADPELETKIRLALEARDPAEREPK